MKTWEYILLFGFGLGLTLAISRAIPVPGYMDAEYYYAGGMELSSGKGFTEPFLWNYLDDPSGLPHPAAIYWMPLASLVGAFGMVVTGRSDYFSARTIFFILAGLVPVFTAWLAFQLTRRKVTAWTAGGLALFSGFYAVYLGLTETFALYMLLGTGFLVASVSPMKYLWKALSLGLLAGLLHLARADGILWLAMGGAYLLFESRIQKHKLSIKRLVSGLAVFAVAYFSIMGFWYLRNLQVFGGVFPPGTSRAMWLVDYDQLYNFPASSLTFQNWLAAGLPTMLKVRWDALLQNLQTLLAVQGQLFLLPLILVGGWRLRKKPIIRVGAIGWLLIFLLMTVIFPLAGSRGGFLHSGAAFQPLFWVVGAEGLAGFVDLGVKWRNWKFQRGTIGFGILCVFVAAVVTLGLTVTRLAPGVETGDSWTSGRDTYAAVDGALNDLGVSDKDVVMVNNPPGFYVTSGRPAIVIPNGDVDTVLSAAHQYHARYLVLEKNSVKDLRGLYQSPVSLPGITYLGSVERAQLFRIENP